MLVVLPTLGVRWLPRPAMRAQEACDGATVGVRTKARSQDHSNTSRQVAELCKIEMRDSDSGARRTRTKTIIDQKRSICERSY